MYAHTTPPPRARRSPHAHKPFTIQNNEEKTCLRGRHHMTTRQQERTKALNSGFYAVVTRPKTCCEPPQKTRTRTQQYPRSSERKEKHQSRFENNLCVSGRRRVHVWVMSTLTRNQGKQEGGRGLTQAAPGCFRRTQRNEKQPKHHGHEPSAAANTRQAL